MEFKQPTVEEVVKQGVNYGVELMGDNFIGFKFVGEQSSFWNGLLMGLYQNGEDVSAVLNTEWLDNQGVAYSNHSSEVFNQ